MDPILTTEQQDNLKTWAGQRDGILSQISILTAESERLQIINNNLTVSNTDIEARMNEVRGRIEELKTKETELPLVISKEVATLQSQKNTLEVEITSLTKIVEILTTRKTSLESDVSFALSTFNAIKDEASMLEKVVDKVTMVSADNTSKINYLVNDLAKSLEEIIAVNRKNVAETNIVIEKLPAMIVEAQKHGLIKTKI